MYLTCIFHFILTTNLRNRAYYHSHFISDRNTGSFRPVPKAARLRKCQQHFEFESGQSSRGTHTAGFGVACSKCSRKLWVASSQPASSQVPGGNLFAEASWGKSSVSGSSFPLALPPFVLRPLPSGAAPGICCQHTPPSPREAPSPLRLFAPLPPLPHPALHLRVPTRRSERTPAL